MQGLLLLGQGEHREQRQLLTLRGGVPLLQAGWCFGAEHATGSSWAMASTLL